MINKYCLLNGEKFLVLGISPFTPHLTNVQKLDSSNNPIRFVIGSYETLKLEFIK